MGNVTGDAMPNVDPWAPPPAVVRPPSGTFEGLNIRQNEDALARRYRGERPLPGGSMPEPLLPQPTKPIT